MSAGGLSIGVSIVLYRTRVGEIQELIDGLLEQGAAHLYIVDNSPLSFDTFGAWNAPARVSIVRHGRNVGYGSGHNIPMRDSIARHDYHLVCNPDIRLGAGTLPSLFALMQARGDVGLVMPEVVGPDGGRHYLCKRAPSPLNYLPGWLLTRRARERLRHQFEMRDHDYDEEFEVECLSGCFMFLRSAALQRAGVFDERFFMYFEDFDLSRRMRTIGRNLYYPRARIVHEHRSEHRRSLRLLLVFAMSAARYFTKWGWFEARKSRAGLRSTSMPTG
jgi:GT2 family glycosyltransferase